MAQRLRIAHVYPEQMNIYGDRGNIITLTQRCRWRGIDVELQPVGVGTAVDWTTVDIAFFGGGQDSGQALVADDFRDRHGASLRAAVDDGLVMLTICGGYQLLGHYFLTHTGEKLPGIGAIDVHTVGGDVRLIGNTVVEADMTTDDRPLTTASSQQSAVSRQSSVVRLVGFENHSGRTYLGTGARSLGKTLVGAGNNGEDGTGGAVYRNTFGCYMHGSLLPKNPQFADHLIELALERRYGRAELAALDDTFEQRAQQTMIARLVRA